ncbi:hypothetical protein CGI28_25470, partial [Vibrio parahaemolyticus]
DLGELGDDFLDDLEEFDSPIEESGHSVVDEEVETEVIDKASNPIDKVIGFKLLTDSEARKIKRFMALIEDRSESDDSKRALM